MATTTPVSVPQDLGDAEWFSVGLASSYPNITASTSSEPYFKLAWPQPCPKDPSPEQKTAGCRIFHPKPTTATSSSPSPTVTAEEISVDAAPGEDAWFMREQVVVFRYEGRFHAVDHACPHRAWSLAWSQPFDIEDAGRVVGRGLRCRGHGYAFELTTGAGDRGSYQLGIWEVELRPCAGKVEGGVVVGGGDGEEEEEREVWVRRKAKSG